MENETQKQIKKSLKWYLLSKYAGMLLSITALILAIIISFTSFKPRKVLFVNQFTALFIIFLFLVIFVIINTNAINKLNNINKNSLDEYLQCVCNTTSYWVYSEYILWFSRYVRKQFIERLPSRKVSLLHEVTLMNDKGLCPASFHMSSFKKLAELILNNNLDNLNKENDKELEMLKEDILSVSKEKVCLFPTIVLDRYIVMYSFIGIIQFCGAIISGSDIDYVPPLTININFLQKNVIVSNLCFYLPLVCSEILIHKGYVSQKEQKTVMICGNKKDEA